MQVYVDSNVFMYAAGGDHPQKAPCSRVLRQIAAGELAATTSAEVIQELHHVYRRRGLLKEGIAMGQQIALLIPNLLPVTKADVLRSGEILTARPQLSPRDALHAATALNNGVELILSVDTDFDQLDGIRRLDPSAL